MLGITIDRCGGNAFEKRELTAVFMYCYWDKTVQIYKRARGEGTSENIAWNQEKTTTKKMKERFKDERDVYKRQDKLC